MEGAGKDQPVQWEGAGKTTPLQRRKGSIYAARRPNIAK